MSVRIHEFNTGLASIHDVSFSGLEGNSLCADLLSSLLGVSLQGVIISNSGYESLSALTGTNVLNSHVDSLGNDSVSNSLVDDHTEGMCVDVEHTTSLSVVELVGHALVNGTISNDVDELSLSVSGHYSAERYSAVLSESLLEQISSLRPISVMVRHLYYPKYLI